MKTASVRDLVAREALRSLVEEASARFRELTRDGEEVPYDVLEPGDGSPLCTYAPLTEQFIRERVGIVARFDSFAAAKSAILAAGLARPYLEALGFEPAPTEGRRAEDAIIAFLCRLWEGRSDFALEPARTEEAIAEIESLAEAGHDEVEIVVPVIGLRMSTSRLELATVTLVRADAVDAPVEARASEGSGRAGWEPQFLAVSRCRVDELEVDGDGARHPAASVAARFHAAISAMRLFKPGGIALGPHGWIRSGGGRWRRISTGVARPRPGAYRLAESELAELAAFTDAIERRPAQAAALSRAISRFEAGLERHAVLEALNDYLLALRFLLEGGGPAATSLAVRVAALCAEPAERDDVCETVELAVDMERELWSGDSVELDQARPAAEVASEVEDLVRAILRDAACGHLGTDLRATADEILLADGLAVGEGDPAQRGGTSEWSPRESSDPTRDPQTIQVAMVDEPIAREAAEVEAEVAETGEIELGPADTPDAELVETGELDAAMAEPPDAAPVGSGDFEAAAADTGDVDTPEGDVDDLDMVVRELEREQTIRRLDESASEAARPRRPRDGWVPFALDIDADRSSAGVLGNDAERAERGDADEAHTGELRRRAAHPVDEDAGSAPAERPLSQGEPGRRDDSEPTPIRARPDSGPTPIRSRHDSEPTPTGSGDDWLAEADRRGETLEFPERPPALRLLDARPEEREAIRNRVSNLFPRPETTEWSVGELDYDRRRRREKLGA